MDGQTNEQTDRQTATTAVIVVILSRPAQGSASGADSFTASTMLNQATREPFEHTVLTALLRVPYHAECTCFCQCGLNRGLTKLTLLTLLLQLQLVWPAAEYMIALLLSPGRQPVLLSSLYSATLHVRSSCTQLKDSTV